MAARKGRRSDLLRALDTVVVRVADLEAAVAWYEQKLGLVRTDTDPARRRAVFDLGGTTSLTLWELTRADVPMVPGAATTRPVFAVDDVDAAWATLRERDVLVDPVTESDGGRWFQFRDLDGNRLDAWQRDAPS